MSIVSDERVEELLKNEKEKDAEIERLKALLTRAADALEQHQMVKGDGTITGEVSDLMLIDELRKAAQ